VHVADQTLTIDLADGDSRTVRRATTQPVLRVKAQRPSGKQASGLGIMAAMTENGPICPACGQPIDIEGPAVSSSSYPRRDNPGGPWTAFWVPFVEDIRFTSQRKHSNRWLCVTGWQCLPHLVRAQPFRRARHTWTRSPPAARCSLRWSSQAGPSSVNSIRFPSGSRMAVMRDSVPSSAGG
jgi:hypothetical protein